MRTTSVRCRNPYRQTLDLCRSPSPCMRPSLNSPSYLPRDHEYGSAAIMMGLLERKNSFRRYDESLYKTTCQHVPLVGSTFATSTLNTKTSGRPGWSIVTWRRPPLRVGRVHGRRRPGSRLHICHATMSMGQLLSWTEHWRYSLLPSMACASQPVLALPLE